MFRFASPVFLLFLILFPVLWAVRKKRWNKGAFRVSTLGFNKKMPMGFLQRVATLLPLLKVIALICLIIALARPQWGSRQTRINTEGINIILALDLSGSMAALDFTVKDSIVTRLDAVKGVVQDFILKREGDRIGLVVFGSQAFTQLPLNRDYNTISFVLERLKIGAAGPATAIGDALGISLKRLEDIKSDSNVIILLTDGKSNAGELTPEAAARIAKERGVKIYTIGVGEKGKAPFLINDPMFGERYVYRQVEMDHETLEKIADLTGGSFFPAKNIASLEKIYDMIDRLEKTEVEVTAWAEYHELYQGLTLFAFLLLGLYLLLSHTRMMRIP